MFPDVTGVVLVGGHGRRLGHVDKSQLLHPTGTTFFDYIVSQLREFVTEIIAVGRPEQEKSLSGRFVADVLTNAGPLAALTTLRNIPTQPWLFVIAADMPYFEKSLFHLLANQRTAVPNATAIVSMTAEMIHPTCALYHRSALEIFSAEVLNNQYSFRRALPKLSTTFVQIPEELHRCLKSINTTLDLEVLTNSLLDTHGR